MPNTSRESNQAKKFQSRLFSLKKGYHIIIIRITLPLVRPVLGRQKNTFWFAGSNDPFESDPGAVHRESLTIDVLFPQYPNSFYNGDLQDKQLDLVPVRLGIGADIFDTSKKGRVLFLVN